MWECLVDSRWWRVTQVPLLGLLREGLQDSDFEAGPPHFWQHWGRSHSRSQVARQTARNLPLRQQTASLLVTHLALPLQHMETPISACASLTWRGASLSSRLGKVEEPLLLLLGCQCTHWVHSLRLSLGMAAAVCAAFLPVEMWEVSLPAQVHRSLALDQQSWPFWECLPHLVKHRNSTCPPPPAMIHHCPKQHNHHHCVGDGA
mmetsp:Transcript_64614/g.154389  ORF Transcript_64614/g.154389 Transcript_64614/m.154389 type:complete len:204 (-) Transcript_64614:493-1104(-)